MADDPAGGNPEACPQRIAADLSRLCHLGGGELDQIQFLLGHPSTPTAERYLGFKHISGWTTMAHLMS